MNKICTYFLSFCLLLSAALPLKSEAAVGLIKEHKKSKVLGGLATGGGLVFSTLVYAAASNSTATGWAALGAAISASVYITLGLAVAAVGAVVLEEDPEVTLMFMPLENISGVDQNILLVYHTELDQLNAITQDVESQVKLNPEVDTKALWAEYGQSLSPETLQVARSIAQGFLSK